MVYVRARGVMELVPPGLRKLWKDGELRVLVLFSLALQIVLIVFGNRRKYTGRIWIQVTLWLAYLMADWVATVALGVISNNLGDVIDNQNDKGFTLDVGTELAAFWAPFLLLHLGGPDTITAYSIEDNELWLRHLLGLLVQTAVALHIFLVAWKASYLSILTIPMIFAGLIKYGERTWVLRSASSEQFRDSMLTTPDPGPNYPKFMEEYTLKQHEGFYVMADKVTEAQIPVNYNPMDNNPVPDAAQLLKAYDLFQIVKCLFADLILGFDDRESSQCLFEKMSIEEAFKVIEIELGFMYDVLYTKAAIIYTRRGFIFRSLTFSLTCLVLVFFCSYDKKKYECIDLVITFLLLITAIGLELYALLLILSSDWTALWLSKHVKTPFPPVLRLFRVPRWSNSLVQYNVLNSCLNDKPKFCTKLLELLHVDIILENYQYTFREEVMPELKELIYSHLKEKYEFLKAASNGAEALGILSNSQGGMVLEKYGFPNLNWSVEGGFDQSILIWHIATDLCYLSDFGDITRANMPNYESSLVIAQYMLYLLVMCPFMLPVGIGMIRLRDTCSEAKKFFEERRCLACDAHSDSRLWNLCTQANEYFRERDLIADKVLACNMLLEVNTEVPPTKVKGDRSKSVLFDACRLAQQLNRLDKGMKWEMISNVWVEMLAYAANHCRANYHAQQLKRGGELLTHVWLLMAHFGITQQCQISHGHARAKLTTM